MNDDRRDAVEHGRRLDDGAADADLRSPTLAEARRSATHTTVGAGSWCALLARSGAGLNMAFTWSFGVLGHTS